MRLTHLVTEARALLEDYKDLTPGEWAAIPAGTVMEKDNGALFVIYQKANPKTGSGPHGIMGYPHRGEDPLDTQDPPGKFRVVGSSPKDVVQALSSLAVPDTREGKPVALIRTPGPLAKIFSDATDTPAEEKAVVAAVLKRMAVYGKKNLAYADDAHMGSGFAVVYLKAT